MQVEDELAQGAAIASRLHDPGAAHQDRLGQGAVGVPADDHVDARRGGGHVRVVALARRVGARVRYRDDQIHLVGGAQLLDGSLGRGGRGLEGDRRGVGRHRDRALAQDAEEADLDTIGEGLDKGPLDGARRLQGREGVVPGLGGVELEVRGKQGHLEPARDGSLDEAGEGRGRPVELVVAQDDGVVAHFTHLGHLHGLGRAEHGEGGAHEEVAAVKEQKGRGAGGGALGLYLGRQARVAAQGRVVPRGGGRVVRVGPMPHEVRVQVVGVQDDQLGGDLRGRSVGLGGLVGHLPVGHGRVDARVRRHSRIHARPVLVTSRGAKAGESKA